MSKRKIPHHQPVDYPVSPFEHGKHFSNGGATVKPNHYLPPAIVGAEFDWTCVTGTGIRLVPGSADRVVVSAAYVGAAGQGFSIPGYGSVHLKCVAPGTWSGMSLVGTPSLG